MKKQFLFKGIALIVWNFANFQAVAQETASIYLSPQLKYFGYYYSGLYLEKKISSGNNPQNTNAAKSLKIAENLLEQINILWIAPGDPNYQIKQVQIAEKYQKKFILDIQNVVFENNFRLRSDYEVSWKNYSESIRPYMNNLAAFYTLDEPNLTGHLQRAGLSWSKMSEQLEKVNRLIKETFPEAPIAVIFGYGSGDGDYLTPYFRIPAGFDWVALDSYGHWDEPGQPSIPLMIQALESHMNRNQFLFMVPDGFSYGKVPSASEQQVYIKRNRRYLGLCNSKARCIGLIPFIYQNVPPLAPGYKSTVGIESMPYVAAEFAKMGKEIVTEAHRNDPSMPPPLIVDHSTLGFIDNVFLNLDGSMQIQGWACAKEYIRSIKVRVYAVDSANNKKVLGNFLANSPTGSDISENCLSSGNFYGFSINVKAARIAKQKGKKVYITGLNPFAGSRGVRNTMIDNSGFFLIP